MRVTHPIPPVFDENSKILILGSFPSVKSREEGFYYGHPSNRFWRTLAAVYGTCVPSSVPEKRAFLLSHGLALWDVIGECDITGSADSSIKNEKLNDLSLVFKTAEIQKIVLNGGKAFSLYEKYHGGESVRYFRAPSTSPANASFSAARLVAEWEKILKI